jgi:hypothetical protein
VSPALEELIRALARAAVDDHLASQCPSPSSADNQQQDHEAMPNTEANGTAR